MTLKSPSSSFKRDNSPFSAAASAAPEQGLGKATGCAAATRLAAGSTNLAAASRKAAGEDAAAVQAALPVAAAVAAAETGEAVADEQLPAAALFATTVVAQLPSPHYFPPLFCQSQLFAQKT